MIDQYLENVEKNDDEMNKVPEDRPMYDPEEIDFEKMTRENTKEFEKRA